MKTIKIFLASSEELDYDRNVFGNLIRRLDDLYEKRGIRIKLFEWEDYDSAYNDQRKQKEYNERVRESDIFLALFHKNAGKFTLEEFDVASEQFKATASPKIFTFCKDIKQGDVESQDLVKFKKKLFEEMGHYWCRYDSRESLQFQFVMQLQLVESGQMSDLKLEDGNVTLDGIQITTIDKLRFAADNEDYVNMCQKLSLLPEKIHKARLRLDKFPDDEDLADDLQQKLDRYNNLKEEVDACRQLLFKTAQRVAQLQTVQVTDRMRRAMDAFCEGNVREANIILDEVEQDAIQFLDEYKLSKEVTKQIHQTILNSIEELQLKAKTVMSETNRSIEERIVQTEQIYSLADEMAHTVDFDEEKYSQMLIDYAFFLYEYGLYRESIEVYLRLIPLLRKYKGSDNPMLADSYNMLGKVYYYYGDNLKSLKYYFKALKIRRNIWGEEHPDIAESYCNIGLAYKNQHTLDYYFRALKIREKVFGYLHIDTATSYNNIGAMYQRQGDYEKALQYHNKALQIRELILGKEHPHTAFSYNNIGAVYYCLGEYSKSKEYHFKALKIREKVLGRDHPFTASSYGHIGKIFCKEGNYSKALEYHFKDLHICEKVFGTSQPEIAFPYNDIGVVYSKMGNYILALEYLNKALCVRELTLGKEHIDTATSYNEIGTVHFSQGDYVKALGFYEVALTIRTKKLGHAHPDTIQTKDYITEVTRKLKDNAL